MMSASSSGFVGETGLGVGDEPEELLQDATRKTDERAKTVVRICLITPHLGFLAKLLRAAI
tara:strand:+ start:358741 stop:358923 length:183 start_codon:yes stop_codon:yes gene_type:complete